MHLHWNLLSTMMIPKIRQTQNNIVRQCSHLSKANILQVFSTYTNKS